ncbi:MAG TPA: IS66 family transposase ISCth11 [Hungateiclostridium thermocellum]|uniref:Transposase IS66 n=1 Tax=Acetivibrio thermocellus (strain ATCC 27405 / DSM 1237 / JCM 9322 / NBRC 103400 / NCIMB 10682 / NRRL B-4536 / VPI 7372) TaxID=203119 RepID=A3DCS3_ACET2|nr:IS66-like element ISCth11 family transposase [Acetivibrio thermocellus]ABN51752.1 transposase IS66 [Acetivibrio thermocellus ATCC 27405]HBW26917.1 IS66 family transposase ISCth11 [Acetivibrio thermocellus]
MSTAEQIATLENRINELELENKRLHETVAYLTRKLYGRSSEKTSALSVGQVSLFDEAEVYAVPQAPEPDLKEVQGYIRRKYKGQRTDLLKDIPHDKRLCTLAEEDRYCEACGTDLVSVGKEFIRTEIEFIPAKIRVIDYYRETFECRTCRKNGEPYMEKSPMPYPVIQHSMASPSTVAWIMHQKFVNHLPLYRQENEWKMLGVNLKRETMSNWILAAARDWLMPLVDLMHKKLLQEKYLHADETTVQVLNEEGRSNTTNSYMWVYSSGKYCKKQIRLFQYQPGRNGKYPQEFLKGFSGFLHTDAYSGYKKVPEITRCMCWTHLRRYFRDALPKDTQSPEATIPSQGIRFCNKLFEIEETLEKLTQEQRRLERLKQETPVLEAFWSWVDSVKDKVLPKSKIGEAIQYALNNKEDFMNYLLDGNCSISNNLSENSIRPFTLGRKNWLFSGSPRGADASAAVYSIVESAKANDINPYKYLYYIFSELPGVQFGQNPEFLEDYLPWSPDVQAACK